MAKRFITVLFVVLLMVFLAVFSYAVEPPVGTEILEYIESSGTQFIDTQVVASSGFRTLIDIEFPSATSGAIIGSHGQAAPYMRNYLSLSNGQYQFGQGNGYYYSSSAVVGSKTSIDFSNVYGDLYLKVDGVNQSFTQGESGSNHYSSYPLYLFWCNWNNTTPNFFNKLSAILFSCQIYDIGTLVRDYIPVRINGNVGLWDRVEGEFYGNSGTGSFIGGPVVDIVVPPEPEYSISVSTDGNGSASSNLSVATAGTTVTLSASPNDGFEFSEWQVLQGDIDIVNNQFIMPSSNVSVKAIFVPDGYYSVIVENDGNGTGSANPVRAEQGTRVTLSAVPVLGYEFDSWEVVSGSVNISNNQFIMPDSDVVVRAKFKPIVYTITLNQGSNGSATVSQNTAIVGDVITLTATPDDLYSFGYWNVIQGGITVENNQFVMPASNVVLSPVFIEQSAISSGFEYHSGAISGEEEVEFTTIDVDFGEQPAGEYLINIYHWGSGCIPTFQISYNGKYLPFSTTGGVSTVAIEHSGGELVLDGSLSLVKNLLQSAEGTVVFAGEFSNGNIQFHSISSWTFNIEDVVLIPAGLSHVEDYGVYSAIVSFLRDKFDDLISVFGSEESEEDVNDAADELNKEVEDLNNLSGQLDEQKNDLEQQFNSDFKISDELSGQTDNIQLIYTGIFSSFGLFSIFIWLPVVLVVIKKLFRL